MITIQSISYNDERSFIIHLRSKYYKDDLYLVIIYLEATKKWYAYITHQKIPSRIEKFSECSDRSLTSSWPLVRKLAKAKINQMDLESLTDSHFKAIVRGFKSYQKLETKRKNSVYNIPLS